jgi:hypothetical protein
MEAFLFLVRELAIENVGSSRLRDGRVTHTDCLMKEGSAYREMNKECTYYKVKWFLVILCLGNSVGRVST